MSRHLAFNPYLPSYDYVPDGEPRVFGDRLYVYGSHDRFDGTEQTISVTVRGEAAGTVKVYTDRTMPPVAALPLRPSGDWTNLTGKLGVPNGTAPLVFVHDGAGSLDFRDFTIE